MSKAVSAADRHPVGNKAKMPAPKGGLVGIIVYQPLHIYFRAHVFGQQIPYASVRSRSAFDRNDMRRFAGNRPIGS